MKPCDLCGWFCPNRVIGLKGCSAWKPNWVLAIYEEVGVYE